MDVDLSDIQPDFYSGSAHKWICGPKENGVLYISKSAQSKIWASIFSAYPGRVGVSRTFEGFGQRDEPTMIAFGEALTFQTRIGRAQIEKRSRELTQALLQGLKTIDGLKIWTSPDPSRGVAVVSFLPGNLDIRKLSAALYEKDHIGCATRGGQDRRGFACRRTSTIRTPTSTAPSPRSRTTWRPASRCQVPVPGYRYLAPRRRRGGRRCSRISASVSGTVHISRYEAWRDWSSAPSPR